MNTLSAHILFKRKCNNVKFYSCGKALNEWKGKKPVLEGVIRIMEDKMQIELPLTELPKLTQI
ncbi:hypothetical protein [Histophilus somni]|uniref:hypothetical protein n=1 Tax=Histophilus somni TaxID=731 RepID=UPI000165F915|nr:hypothetical protein [Histophilus somni]ACA32580.1 hypothetical protein HSM_0900 [Histophilus somni 2336]